MPLAVFVLKGCACAAKGMEQQEVEQHQVYAVDPLQAPIYGGLGFLGKVSFLGKN